jgi:hypothetical protein
MISRSAAARREDVERARVAGQKLGFVVPSEEDAEALMRCGRFDGDRRFGHLGELLLDSSDPKEAKDYFQGRCPINRPYAVLPTPAYMTSGDRRDPKNYLSTFDPRLHEIRKDVAAAAKDLYGEDILGGLMMAPGFRSVPYGARGPKPIGGPVAVDDESLGIFHDALDEHIAFWKASGIKRVSQRIAKKSIDGTPNVTYRMESENGHPGKLDIRMALVALTGVITDLLERGRWEELERIGVQAKAWISRRLQWEQHPRDDDGQFEVKLREAITCDQRRVIQNPFVFAKPGQDELDISLAAFRAAESRLEERGFEWDGPAPETIRAALFAMRVRINVAVSGPFNALELALGSPVRGAALAADKLLGEDAMWAGSTAEEIIELGRNFPFAVIVDVKDFQNAHAVETIYRCFDAFSPTDAGRAVLHANTHPRLLLWPDDPSSDAFAAQRRGDFSGSVWIPEAGFGPSDGYYGLTSGRGLGADENYLIGGSLGTTTVRLTEKRFPKTRGKMRVRDAGDNIWIACADLETKECVEQVLRERKSVAGYQLSPSEGTFRGYIVRVDRSDQYIPLESIGDPLEMLELGELPDMELGAESDALRGMRKLIGGPERDLLSISRRNWGEGFIGHLSFYLCSPRGLKLYQALSRSYQKHTGGSLAEVIKHGPKDVSVESAVSIAHARYLEDPDRIHFDPTVADLSDDLLVHHTRMPFEVYAPLHYALSSAGWRTEVS